MALTHRSLETASATPVSAHSNADERIRVAFGQMSERLGISAPFLKSPRQSKSTLLLRPALRVPETALVP